MLKLENKGPLGVKALVRYGILTGLTLVEAGRYNRTNRSKTIIDENNEADNTDNDNHKKHGKKYSAY